jgi:hypothetical protein
MAIQELLLKNSDDYRFGEFQMKQLSALLVEFAAFKSDKLLV